MDPFILFPFCLAAGGLAAALGLGGGIFLVPFLVLWGDVPTHQAAAASLICCLATSAGGSVALDKARLADFGLLVHLEVFAALGAIAAALVATSLPARLLNGLFALVLGVAAARMILSELRSRTEGAPADAAGEGAPTARNVPLGFGLAAMGGAASALLGIGGGPINVPLQTEVLKVPLPVALANSNVMVGITAGFGAAVYYAKGTIPPSITATCAVGMALGAYAGGLVAPKLRSRWLALAFGALLSFLCARMLWQALAGD